MGVKERESSYFDYGIDDARLKYLLLLIRNDINAQDMFLRCCREVSPELATDLWYSFTGRISYDDLKIVKSVPITKIDFYACRRKAVYIFNLRQNAKEKREKLKNKKEQAMEMLEGQIKFDEV